MNTGCEFNNIYTDSDTDSDNSSINELVNNEKINNIMAYNGLNISVTSELLKNYNVEYEKKCDSEEEILNYKTRVTLTPFDTNYSDVWKLYKYQLSMMWTREEIDFIDDANDFKNLDKNTQKFIKSVLSFFASADSIVNLNIDEKLNKITVNEIKTCYGFQSMMEQIHSETYSEMLNNIISDEKEKELLFNGHLYNSGIKKMIEFGTQWTVSNRRIGYILIAYCIFEGLFFSGAFAAIYWLKNIVSENKMKGLIHSNNFIARDESLHTFCGYIVYSKLKHKINYNDVVIMIKEAMTIVKEFYKESIDVNLIGISYESMSEYLESIADRIVINLGYKEIYGTKIPDNFSFMNNIGIFNKTNFFENRSTDYQTAYNNQDNIDWQFKILTDF